jgi:hypothetical protein
VSAECSTCGCDIVYGDDDWPIGHCPVCKSSDDLKAFQRAARLFLRAEERAITTIGKDYGLLRLGRVGAVYNARRARLLDLIGGGE